MEIKGGFARGWLPSPVKEPDTEKLGEPCTFWGCLIRPEAVSSTGYLTWPLAVNSRTQNEGHPKWFVLGVGQVIKGLDIAMMNMCPGEKRKVTIPPSLAYGQQGYAQGKIPPNATLVFEIELYAVNKGPRSVEAFNQIDKDGDKKLSELEISQYLKEEFARDGKKRHPSAHDEILADIFKKNDHDGDGFISAKEYNVYQHDEL
ncbi:peptidyl-prolyl cis-trans isomerase FKBP7 [Cyanistes caeruleus]|uniref:peptidyl-prolyl cis-trans isomerase FKBP7 n=1 Tax=Cyanistes caeruleus TaxID=156563 RepID=UPI000CDAF65E|nr:peptidyl-prolyl cis-trans isomerase FKBP7 [Cyanistes caeruleus]